MEELLNKIIDAIAQNPEMTNKEIAAQVGCSNSHPYQVKKKYALEIAERAIKYGRDLDELDNTIIDNIPDINELESFDASTFAFGPLPEYQDDERPLWKQVVDYIARNPGATNKEVANAVGCSRGYPSDVRDSRQDEIEAHIEEYGTSMEEFEESNQRRMKKRPTKWGEFSTTQQKVLERLSQEPDPRNSDTSLRQLANEINVEKTPSITTITDVECKYGEFAVLLKEIRELVDEDQDPQEIAHAKTLPELRGWVEKAKEMSESSSDEAGVDTANADGADDLNAVWETLENLRTLAETESKYSDSQLAKIRLEMLNELESSLFELDASNQSEVSG